MVENTDTSKWYVVHCHSGFEKKVADSIIDEAKKVNLEDSISCLLYTSDAADDQ